ncbi:deoxyribodipyrimidine photolyase [Qipengyuania citrea LAMA 915]|jgi:renalase|uniref:Deoxyribodipyrimidine photolyase n=1 Tax=Qipengyuania citrea LAMA 915 TaxID=1306953 RepID=A0A0L1KFM7_9SPHN|nr:FAD-dependent oxidoreductase [Qipengyuania citrea]KNH02865.1 deoxyribodipyrimidine photolyase [Qipengyuania citrea LAMA 915]
MPDAGGAMRVAIVGAGMAGMSCGQRLSRLGHEVRLFDKGRGPGGRMATRRMECGGTTLHFDHGAQYFTAREPRFVDQVAHWEATGVAARWAAAGDDAWVGTPAMNAPLKAMAGELGVQFGTRIEQLVRDGEGWQIDGEGAPDARFDAVLVAVPAEQAGPLLQPHAPAMATLADQTASDPCWTLMAGFEAPLALVQDTLRQRGPIGWAARNNAKPGRASEECWVIQASPEWSRAHLEEDAETVAAALLAELAEANGGPLPRQLGATAHRWRFARSGTAGEEALWDAEQRIGVCGDWLIGPRVEAAYMSGLLLAEAVGGR